MKRKILTISLIVSFSVLLWVFVSFSGEFSITVNLPTKVVNIPENLSVSSISAKEVSITLKGQGWQLAQHTLGRNPKFFLPSPESPGEEKIPTRNVIYINSWLSSTLQLAEIHPEIVTVVVEEKVLKIVEIIPVVSLTFKPGYGLVSKLSVEPDSVKIEGPKSIVAPMTSISTKGVGLTNLEKGETIKLQLENIDYVKPEISECKVTFDVQKIVDKTFTNLIVNTDNIPSRYELILSPAEVELTLRGGLNLLSKMKNSDINIFVDFDQAINDTNGFVEPQIYVPEFTSIVEVKPNHLEYIIKKY